MEPVEVVKNSVFVAGGNCLIFGVLDSTETFLTVRYCSQFSMHSVFRNLCMPCAMELFSSALSSSAMDSSAIGVGVAVLVGKC